MEMLARLSSYMEALEINLFETHSVCELISVPWGCWTKVPVTLLAVSQKLFSAPRGHSRSPLFGVLHLFKPAKVH